MVAATARPCAPRMRYGVTFADEWATAWANFQSDESWLPPGEYATGELVRLMRSRRSCRNFMDKAVPLDLLEDLVRIGVTAPSGTNCQLWTFTLLPTRERVMTLSDKIKDFFRDLNKKAEMSWLRNALALVGQPDLKNYYYEYYASVRGAIEAWEERGEDRLFYSAPAAILVGMRPGASCPAEDAMLATQNLLLGAHALGLGTCLIGYAVEAMRHTPRIKDAVNIPRKEPVYAVIALGWPAWPEEAYQRVTSRRKPLVRI